MGSREKRRNRLIFQAVPYGTVSALERKTRLCHILDFKAKIQNMNRAV
jgi:hypothetical protein